jgi:ribonuclease HII
MVKADQKVPAVSAASIIAKTVRDHYMTSLDQRYPGYNFAAHKGYPTAHHVETLQVLGPCPEHRQSFGPVKALSHRSIHRTRAGDAVER